MNYPIGADSSRPSLLEGEDLRKLSHGVFPPPILLQMMAAMEMSYGSKVGQSTVFN
uniref:Uncharacterized protein n=1 Tax=Arundo donax TaxID=35708 RepID=A0A0A9ELX6_ARUDO